MRESERERGGGEATRHKHSVAWHGISIDIYTVSMGISTRSDGGRAPPNTADSDPARSTQTRESIVAFKLPSYSGGLTTLISYVRATSRSIDLSDRGNSRTEPKFHPPRRERLSPSVISDHRIKFNHNFDWEEVKILDTENFPFSTKNRHVLLLGFMIFCGSGFSIPFFMVRHQMKK
ncbi:hypothetical protein ALC56_01821 [Trachymyrmex septentrionalis]|uniref:Uncharacterized protein n=1 Tax=Trachymyrmex septentrionalis TaxID=34720 RepID=A0A195FSJ6_9HYME|nr:hypothetical protein ALC56_01821 [Trachymyrmex septentrionalis]